MAVTTGAVVVVLVIAVYFAVTRPCQSGAHRRRHWRHHRYDGIP